MSNEPISGQPYQQEGSKQTDTVQNSTLNYFSAWTNCSVLSVGATTPPGSPVNGDRHIVGTSATGAWATYDDNLAVYRDGWQFYAPPTGGAIPIIKNSTDGADWEYVSATWQLKASGSGVLTVNGDAGPHVTAVTQGKHEVPLDIGALFPSATNGAGAITQSAGSAGQPDLVYMPFDGTATEYAEFRVWMPVSWDEGTVKLRFAFDHASSSGDVIWGGQAVAVGDGDTLAANFGTAQEVTKTSAASGALRVTAETPAITIAGTPAAGDWVRFRVYRKAADALDTLNGVDARLHSIKLILTTNADNDA